MPSKGHCEEEEQIGAAKQNWFTRSGNSLLLPVDTVQYGKQSMRFLLHPAYWFSVLTLMSHSILAETGKCVLCVAHTEAAGEKLSLSSIN